MGGISRSSLAALTALLHASRRSTNRISPNRSAVAGDKLATRASTAVTWARRSLSYLSNSFVSIAASIWRAMVSASLDLRNLAAPIISASVYAPPFSLARSVVTRSSVFTRTLVDLSLRPLLVAAAARGRRTPVNALTTRPDTTELVIGSKRIPPYGPYRLMGGVVLGSGLPNFNSRLIFALLGCFAVPRGAATLPLWQQCADTHGPGGAARAVFDHSS